eukprot:CAMPEP_0195062730 /NCGR_PEP_ID=MMETSP0448-20130528/9271_1 /TAXON_ID=66468 /ORGANISM="Heterocapsa triquestra, Strain CCMP 448" /LENGTH=645 /DNA_ID=CAMNT_0040093471 /DNA_START=107 /DNA_END=2044 /DNA_ORIENTATION=+
MAKLLLEDSLLHRELTIPQPTSPGALDCSQISQLGAHDVSPLAVLHLNKEVLLDGWERRATFRLVHVTARVLPALVIFGGTGGLLVCAICHYRWGVLFALTLYSIYMLHLGLTSLIFASVGLVRMAMDAGVDWQERYRRLTHKQRSRPLPERWAASPSQDQGGDSDPGELGWRDVIHVVMVPSYKTPKPVLVETLEALTKFSMAKTNLAVCLAFEEREYSSPEKARELCEEFESRFLFILVSFHPPNLPNHLPGKSSNECWAFLHLRQELEEVHHISSNDPRVVITVIDDDSMMHENYFEALTYSFLAADERKRYMTTWQPPICQFKNYLRQPMLVRISSLFSSLHELSCLANPIDCHVPFSSYSISLVLASAVGGWDPDYLAEDWHMFAKCSLMTEGRIRCQPIFLPLLNYTPEEETYLGTLGSRFEQAKRHALGVSELVYVCSTLYLAVLELPSMKRALIFLWRLAPLLGKFAQVHFVNGMSAVFTLLAQLVIHYYMLRSWCYLSESPGGSGPCSVALSASQASLGDEQILLNSWLVLWQQRATAVMASCSLLTGGLGAFYFHLVKDRVDGDVEAHWNLRHVVFTWLVIELEVTCCGLPSAVIFGAAPLWLACLRILRETRFSHVAAGMLGRSADDEADEGDM